MLGKRKSSRPIAQVKKRRKGEPVIEEIRFDFDAREEYLTGFHKRKLQRIKHAKEEALKREREEKVAARKVLRDNRRIDREKHVEAVNAAVREAENVFESQNSEDDEGSGQWDGIEAPEAVDHEDDYHDDDRHTVVTVEAVDVSRDGLERRLDDPGSGDEDDSGGGNGTKSAGRKAASRLESGNRPSGARQSKVPDPRPKKKKKKFRYESKAERKATRFKERSGGKAKAKARRE